MPIFSISIQERYTAKQIVILKMKQIIEQKQHKLPIQESDTHLHNFELHEIIQFWRIKLTVYLKLQFWMLIYKKICTKRQIIYSKYISHASSMVSMFRCSQAHARSLQASCFVLTANGSSLSLSRKSLRAVAFSAPKQFLSHPVAPIFRSFQLE